jgi:GT2 family glycosyltransferase
MTTSKSISTISIVIVTWNGKKYALECLDSLRALGSATNIEVVVVDNASTDGTPQAIREHYPEVRLIQNEANLGFAKANNIGIREASGSYVCLVNSDVVVPPGCLEKMTDYMEAHPGIGVLGPRMRAPDGGTGLSVMKVPTVWNSLCCALGNHRGGYMMEDFSYDNTEDVEVLTGWFWMVRKTALDEVGGLDERFFMYGEDIDWCYRFTKGGWRVVYYADAEALHYGAASSNNAPVRFYVEMHRANLQCFRKHHGALASGAFILVTWLHQLVRLAGYGALFVLRPCKRSSAELKIQRSLSCLGWLADGAPGGRAQ